MPEGKLRICAEFMRNNRSDRNRSHRPDRRSAADHRAPALRLDGPAAIGKNTFLEIVRRKPERLLRAFFAESESSGREELVALAKRAGIPYEFCHPSQITAATGSDSHQGVAGVLRPRHHPELKELLQAASEQPRALIVMLDSIYDPHNLGAILRACECFGASGVILSKNRGTGITPAVTKTSVGATEFVPISIVSNLAQALQRAIDMGFEAFAADVGPGTEPLVHCEFSPLSVLVLGSEGEGVQPLLRKLCSRAVTIPMSGVIDSLNVSQAASIMLYEWSASRYNTDGQRA